MAVEDDVREIRGHVLGLVKSVGEMRGELTGHARPCPDVKSAHSRLDTLEKQSGGGGGNALRAEQGIVRMLIVKVLSPLVAAIGGVLAYVFATKP